MQSLAVTAAMVLVLSLSARSDELTRNISSISANIKIGKTIEITRIEDPIFGKVICNFFITQVSSTPPSVLLAGKVVSNNSGGAQEFVPVFFGSSLHHPQLAALTNADGEFRFRVWLVDKRNEKLAFRPGTISIVKGDGKMAFISSTLEANRLQATSIRDATLYLEGKFDKDAEMISSSTHIYSLRNFLAQNAKQKP